jgi:hypothetical protein
MIDDELLKAFEACEIPRDEWRHRTHVRVAYLYLCRHQLPDAIDKMRAGVKRLNAANGVSDTPTTGYNETTTVAWMRLIHAVLCEQGPSQDSECFLTDQPYLGNRTLLRLFYSRDIWSAQDCKSTFVPPDLAPLPAPHKLSSVGYCPEDGRRGKLRDG